MADHFPDRGTALGSELSDAVVAFHEAIGGLLGLSAADHKALGILQREGAMSAGELAARTSLTAGAVTGLVDRLEAAGLARRDRDHDDRRRLVVTASRPTDPRVAAAFAALGSAMAEVTAGFTLEQQQVIARWAEMTTAVLREQAAALRRSA
ncbi:MarR family winged helix-turn-helix transcriptional regulator [Pseudactinotalea terrae]|uniref:MarR family winged helix-turn-helix transcriptional regulator n=1 Tax=Pseudactinotalea terrae TaxID=1743262 RepID=UPI0012E2158A|nr:MarR family transcriptional regulator [Pseudactinotalea terrae]